jgi:hypothetical protein
MQHLSYVPLERIRILAPVERTRFIVDRCRGRAVLDLGCYDETATIKLGTDEWLHGAIGKVARSVLGVDSSASLPEGGLKTGENARIIRGDVARLDELSLGDAIEVIVAGELLEHLPHPLEFLCGIQARFSGRELVLTTPNASSLTNAMLGLVARESNHRDHLHVFSYKTLNTLCRKAGFTEWEIFPYHVRFTEMILQARGLRRAAVITAERMVNLGERAFPLLAGGLALHVSRI